MYHIKKDKRCVKSADAIVAALEQLLEQKGFMEITVSDIQRASGVGRSTFYRLFDTIDDVVTLVMDKTFEEILCYYEHLSFKDFTVHWLETIIASSNRLMNIMGSGRSDLIVRSFRRNLQNALVAEDEESLKDAYYNFAAFAGTCTSVIATWDELGRKESIEELADIILMSLNIDQITGSGSLAGGR